MSTNTRGLQEKAVADYEEKELSSTSSVIIYAYPPNEGSGVIARESVVDFFYPHIACKKACEKLERKRTQKLSDAETRELLLRLQMRRDVCLLAFEAVQKLPPTDKWSFFQIGGIHGLPYTLYDGAGKEGEEGYCKHGSPLFPTWHRPYVMLLEQSIIRHAQLLQIFNAVEMEMVSKVVEELRMPYWDWADHASRTTGLPDIFTATDITLLYPWKSFSRRSIPNPLKAFVSPWDVGTPIGSDIYNPSAKPSYVVPPYSTPYMPSGYPTVRHVSSSFTTNNDSLNLGFLRHVEQNLVEGVHDIFYIQDWDEFSNHKGNHPSVERVHDHLHLIVGGSGGQMSYVDTAGFDPIFFFHHCNVDRLVALWQYCYPKSWMSDPDHQSDLDVDVDAYTPLTPFRCSRDVYICSRDVRLVEKQCGYSYPELIQAHEDDWSPKEMRRYVQDCLYKPANLCEHRWFVVLDGIHKRAFNVPYHIRVFLDLPEADNTTSTISPHYAGSVAIFARSNDNRCTNCDANETMGGRVEITATMLRLGHVNLAAAMLLRSNSLVHAQLPNTEKIIVKLVFVTLCGKQLNPADVPGWNKGGPTHSIEHVEPPSL